MVCAIYVDDELCYEFSKSLGKSTWKNAGLGKNTLKLCENSLTRCAPMRVIINIVTLCHDI